MRLGSYLLSNSSAQGGADKWSIGHPHSRHGVGKGGYEVFSCRQLANQVVLLAALAFNMDKTYINVRDCSLFIVECQQGYVDGLFAPRTSFG